MEEQLLIEQDPFMLEEQRYWTRMQKAHNLQENLFKYHNDSVVKPQQQRKLKLEMHENQKIARR